MCIYGSENASPVGRAWYRPCSYRHQRRHALADWTTDQNIVTCPAAHGTNYAVVVVCVGGGGRGARDSWREVDGVRGHLPGVIWAAGRCGGVGRESARSENGSLGMHILLTLRSSRPAMDLNRTGWVWVKSDEARTMQNSNSFRFAIRGQFHKAKRFVITKIIFVITNVCNFYFTKSTFCILQFTNSKYFYKFV